MQIFGRNLVLREEESDIYNSHDSTIPYEIADPYRSAAARSFIKVRHATHPQSRPKSCLLVALMMLMILMQTSHDMVCIVFFQVSPSRHSDLTPLAIQSTSPSLLPPSTCPAVVFSEHLLLTPLVILSAFQSPLLLFLPPPPSDSRVSMPIVFQCSSF
jgi:hypothetical protein